MSDIDLASAFIWRMVEVVTTAIICLGVVAFVVIGLLCLLEWWRWPPRKG